MTKAPSPAAVQAALRKAATPPKHESAEAPFAPDPPANDGAKPRVTWISTDQIFEPLPPLVQVLPGLHMGRGRPTVIAGYGFSAKTLASQALALAVASGTRAWGHFTTSTPMRVRHFDHEQGQRATLARYQRLAKGHGIEREQLGGRLEVTCFPTLYLNSPGAEDAYVRELEGVDFAIVDALRGSVPGVDENASEIGLYLNMLARVSERTGTSFLLVHHAGKPKDGHDDRRTVLRGSSAIFDASGTVLVVTGSKDEPKHVSMEKTAADAEGKAAEDFYLDVEDVFSDDGLRKVGVRVAYRTKEQVDPPKNPEDERTELDRAILDFVRRFPDCSKREIREGVDGNDGKKDASLDRLERKGLIRIIAGGAGKASKHRVSE